MTGLERNADIVTMCTYAPLFAHVEGWQWRPDLIWFDNLRAMRTPSYFVQQLFAQNAGTHVLPLSEIEPSDKGKATKHRQPIAGRDSLYASAVYDAYARVYIIKVVNVATTPQHLSVCLKGIGRLIHCEATLFHSDRPTAVNTISMPYAVQPSMIDITPKENSLPIQLPPQSFLVVRCR